MRAAVAEAQQSGARLRTACAVLGLSARTVERWRHRPGGADRRQGPCRRPGNALTPAEEAHVLAVMASARYGHLSPKQLVPRLADEGVYLASESTMYRLQRRVSGGRPRRRMPRTHVTRAAVLHRATGPNQVWSWDITYLPTLIHGRFLHLYLVVDVWSRRIVGAAVHAGERSRHAAALVRHGCEASDVDLHGLVLHSDNGAPMRGSTMLATLQWLGIVPSFSRPHVCNDNPYSEALFRTLKTTPAYPRTPFAGLDATRRWVARFVAWYNRDHRHNAIRFVTPAERHSGADVAILARRHMVYARARRQRPERWARHTRNWEPVQDVVLNPPSTTHTRDMKG